MRRVRERFPFLAELAGPSVASWPAEPLVNDLVCRLAAVVNAVAERERGNETISLKLVRELIGARPPGSDSRAVDLMLLACSVVPLEHTCEFQRYGDGWRWAVTAAGAEPVGNEPPPDLDLLTPIRAASACPEIGFDLVFRWVGQVAYIAWNSGNLWEAAGFLADQAFAIIGALPPDTLDTRRVGNLAHVAVVMHRLDHRDADRIVRLIEAVFDNDQLPNQVRMLAGRALSTGAGERSGVARSTRAADILDRGWALNPTDRLQLLSAAVHGDADQLQARLPALIDAARQHDDLVKSVASNRLEHAIPRGRMWTMLLGPVTDLIAGGHVAAALKLIGAWFGLDGDRVREGNVLFTMRRVGSVVWAAAGTAEQVSSDRSTLYEASARALGRVLVDPADATTPLARGDTPQGSVDLSLSDDLHSAFATSLRPDVGAAVALRASDPPTGLVNLSFNSAPLPWLVAESGGPVLPLVMSFENPRPDRQLLRAEIWFGDAILACEEAEAVAAVLGDAGCHVDVIDAGLVDPARFRQSYENPELDLLWVSSHAEFEHVWSTNATLRLSESHVIPLEELASYGRPTGDRRLLVLNSCESGVVAGLGGPSTVGLAGMLASASQAVVAHMWPVPFQESHFFGLLLGLNLAQKLSFIDAFSRSIRSVQEGAAEVRAVLDGHRATTAAASRLDPEADWTFMRVATPCFLE